MLEEKAVIEQGVGIQPLGDRIVVLPEEEPDERASGIVIPECAKERPIIGKVVAVGKGFRMSDGSWMPLSVKVGDRVLYGKFSGNTVKVGEGDKYLMLRQSDVFAVFGQEEAI